MPPSPNANERPPVGPRPEGKAPSAEDLRAQIMRIMWDRKSSETMIVGNWRYVPWIAVSMAALTGLTFFVLVPSVAGFVFGYLAIYSVCFAILAIINYRLVRAMNAHFRREAALRPLLIEIARQQSKRSANGGREAVSKMERVDRDTSKKEQPKNEMMSAMSALPIVGIAFGYAFLWSLTKAQGEHERNWTEFLRQFDAISVNSGKETSATFNESRGSNFAAYFLISLVFFPFLAYWYYDIDKKAERHLKEQWRSEDWLAKGLQ